MGQSLLLCLNIFIQIQNIQSQQLSSITCYTQSCGPCEDPLSPCNLKCKGYEDCKDSSLSCTSGEESECIIDCGAEKACLSTRVYAPSTAKLTVNCNVYGSCENTIIYAGINTDVTLNCDGNEDGCKDVTLYAQQSKNVIINCKDYQSCSDLSIFCGTGECIIDCIPANGNDQACSGVHLDCGSSSKCQIDCNRLNSCESMTYNVNNAVSFQCIGTSTQCSGAPAPFVNPTSSPATSNPSKSPTSRPTSKPSISSIPTVAPTNIELTNTNPTTTKSVTTMRSTKSSSVRSSTTVPTSKKETDLEATETILTVPDNSDFDMFLPRSTLVITDNINEPEDSGLNKTSSSGSFYIYVMLICSGIAILICCCVPLCICLANKLCGSKGDDDNVKNGKNKGMKHMVKSLSIDGPKWNEFTIPSNLSHHKPKTSMLDANHTHHEKEINENISRICMEESESNDIYTWFNEKVKLPQYAEIFILNGYGDLSLIQQLVNMEELEKMGVLRLDHRFQIMAEINKLVTLMSPIVLGSDDSHDTDISNININDHPQKISLMKQRGLQSNTRSRTPHDHRINIANDEFIIQPYDHRDDDYDVINPHRTMGRPSAEFIVEDDNDRVMQQMLTPHNYGHDKMNSHDVLALEISQMEDEEDSVESLNSQPYKIHGVAIERIMNEDIYGQHNHVVFYGHHQGKHSIHGERFIGSLDSNGLNAPSHKHMPNRVSILTNQFSEGKDDDRQIEEVLNENLHEVDEEESDLMMEMVTLGAPQTSSSSDLFGGTKTPR